MDVSGSDDSRVKLTPTEQDMLDGKHGLAVRDAIMYQLEVGKFWDAEPSP